MSKENKVSTAERLKEAMRDAGKRQVDLIRETGIDSGAMSKYLSGKYEPKQNAINKLAIALDVSEMWLWGYDVPKERTASQKKNDVLVRHIVKARKNDDYAEIVAMLDECPEDQYKNLKTIISVFLNK